MGELAQAARDARDAQAAQAGAEDAFRQVLAAQIPAMRKVMPEFVTPARMLQLGMDCYRRNPQLAECPPDTVVSALMTCSALGLEPSAVDGLGRAYVIPRFNKRTGRMEANFELGYAGAVELVMRSGRVLDIYAEVVHERDEFAVTRGTDPSIRHVPYLGKAEPGPVVAAYCVATIAGGGVHSEVMSRRDIDRRMGVSRAKNGPWRDWYDEMAKKTVVLRAAKMLPKSVELQRAVDADWTVTPEPVAPVPVEPAPEETVEVDCETGEVA